MFNPTTANSYWKKGWLKKMKIIQKVQIFQVGFKKINMHKIDSFSLPLLFYIQNKSKIIIKKETVFLVLSAKREIWP